MSDLDWSGAGPRSRRFDDVYFSAEDGLAESRAVFLQGCGLPERWRGRRRFTVGELGFGTALNILALLDLWRREKPEGATLHVFSVEAHPIARDDASRALGAWPELADLAAHLLDRWPRGDGFHRIAWPELGATLDLAHAPADHALAQWTGSADAWFLDGFTPARNPEMWTPDLMAQVARRSAPGAVAATFTVAGSVRRALAAAGFQVDKRPGFGRKRERLEARLPGSPTDEALPRVAVVGAGIAGACLARAFAALGVQALIIDDSCDAQGSPAALVSPRFDAGATPAARLALQAWRRAVAVYRDLPDAVLSEGLVQLEAQPRDARRFDALASGALFATGEALRLSPAEVAARFHEPAAAGGLFLPAALTVEPAAVRRALLTSVDPQQARVRAVRRGDDAWLVLGHDGRILARVDVVVVAAGRGLSALRPDLALRPVRGQLTHVEGLSAPAVAWGGYVAPTRSGVAFGATHDRDRDDTAPHPDDDERNTATLAAALPELARKLSGRPLRSWAGVRATTADRLPLAGRSDDGLYVLGGLGSRGFTWAPLLAEHVAAMVCGGPSPLPRDLAVLVQPDRAAASSPGAPLQDPASCAPSFSSPRPPPC